MASFAFQATDHVHIIIEKMSGLIIICFDSRGWHMSHLGNLTWLGQLSLIVSFLLTVVFQSPNRFQEIIFE
jgi:hypothetical protein